MKPSGKARLAGVMGFPVAHSLSPCLHRFWLAEHGIDGAYVPLSVRREDFSRAVEGLRAAGFAGVNVTIPHKEAAFALAGISDSTANDVGAANLLVFRGDVIEARNTDVEGLTASLLDRLDPDILRDRSVLVLGAGGATRACVLAADRLHAREIRIANRNEERSRILAGTLQPGLAARLACVSWSERCAAARDVCLLINATSAGMTRHAALDMPLETLPDDAAVCDIVYHPLETPLLRAAKARGLAAIDGLGMLMHQAAPSFAAFYGVRPLVTQALRSELEQALADGG